MACNNGNGNRAYQKSCVRYFNNAPQLLAADSENVLTLAGAKVVNSGSSIQVEPQSYDTVKIGLYHLAADAVIAATAAGVLTLQWYMDGVALPCTLSASRCRHPAMRRSTRRRIWSCPGAAAASIIHSRSWRRPTARPQAP